MTVEIPSPVIQTQNGGLINGLKQKVMNVIKIFRATSSDEPWFIGGLTNELATY